jgi:hypothetical protein
MSAMPPIATEVVAAEPDEKGHYETNGTAAKVGLVANIRLVAVKGVRRNGVEQF